MRIISVKYVFSLTEAQVSEKSSNTGAIEETKPLIQGFTHRHKHSLKTHVNISSAGFGSDVHEVV